MNNLEKTVIIRKNGNEKFSGMDKKLTLKDFWSWAYSDTFTNTERGKLAEFIVASALDAEDCIQDSWAPYDLLTKDGIRIQVKASSYLQSWPQREYSKIIFGIEKTRDYSYETNQYDEEARRQCDLYVFCVYKALDKNTADPLNVNEWEFYAAKTADLDECCGEQKKITLGSLKSKSFVKGPFGYKELKNIVDALMKE